MRYLSLRRQLHLMILVVLIPLLILQIMGIANYRQRMIESRRQADMEFAEVVQSAFLNHVNYLWDFGHSIGSTIVATESLRSPDQIEEYLRKLHSTDSVYEVFSWVNPKGEVIVSTGSETRGQSVYQLDVIQQIIDGADHTISGLTKGDSTQELVLLAKGIRRDGKLEGIFVVGVLPSSIENILPLQRNEESVSYGFIDPDGDFIYRQESVSDLWEITTLPMDSPGRLALQGQVVKEHLFLSKDQKKEYLGVVLPMAEIGWGVSVASSRDQLLGKVKRYTYNQLSFFLLIFAVSLLVALLMGKRFLDSVKCLQRTALAISKGNFSARTMIDGSDEFGTTGQIFDQMAEKIQHLEESRHQFLQTAARELRNPMTGIKGVLSLIRRQVETRKNISDSQQMLGIMEKEIDRLSRLLNQIIEAFRTQREAQYLALQCTRIDLVEVVTEAVQPFLINDKDVQIQIESQVESGALIYGDFVRLEEVIRNLVSNGVKYSSMGGKVWVKLQRQGENWLIAVQDQGVGISKELLEGIFDSFYQMDKIQDEIDLDRMGFGLYICKAIINAHKGEIWATSEKGYGSTFFIRIPGLKNKGELR